METKFELIGENEQLLLCNKEVMQSFDVIQSTAEKSGRSIDEVLEGVANKAAETGRRSAQAVGESASKISESLSMIFTSEEKFLSLDSIEKHLANFSIDKYRQQLEDYGKAGNDATAQLMTLKMALEIVQKEIDGTAVEETERIKQLTQQLNELEQMRKEVVAYNAREFQNSGISFEVSGGNADILSNDELAKNYRKQHEGWGSADLTQNAEQQNTTTQQMIDNIDKLIAEYEKLSEAQDYKGAAQKTEEILSQQSKLYRDYGNQLEDIWARLKEAQLSGDEELIKSLKSQEMTIIASQEALSDAMVDTQEWGAWAKKQIPTTEDLQPLDEYSSKLEEVKERISQLEEQNKTLKESGQEESEQYKKNAQEVKNLTEELKTLENQKEKTAKSGEDNTSNNSGDSKGAVIDIEGNSGKFSKLKEAMEGVAGGFGQIIGGFKQIASGGAGATKGISMVTNGVKMLGKTLVANPIGAIIGAIVLVFKQLKEAFQRNEDAMTAWQKIISPFKALWQSIQRLFDDVVKVFVRVYNQVSKLMGGFSGFNRQLKPFASIIAVIRTRIAILGTLLENFFKALNKGKDFLSNWIGNSKIASFLNGIKTNVQNFFNSVNSWIEKVANSKLGKRLGLDSLYEEIKGIWGAQDELTKKNKEIADAENALNKQRRQWQVESAKKQAEIQKLNKEYIKAEGDVEKQREISNKISAKEKEIKQGEYDLALKEYEFIKMRNSPNQTDSQGLDEEKSAEARMILAKSAVDNFVTSQERRLSRRGNTFDFSNEMKELNAEKSMRLETYEQMKIAARDNKDELKSIDKEEFEYKQEMEKKGLEIQLKYHKINENDYVLRLKQMEEAHKTYLAKSEAGEIDYLRDLRLANEQEERKLIHDERVNELQFEISIESDKSKQLELQKKLRKENLDYALKELEADKRETIRKEYGDEGLAQYDNGKLNDVKGVMNNYNKREANLRSNYSRDELKEDISNYNAYVDAIIAAEQRRQNSLLEGGQTREQIDDIYNTEVSQAAKGRGIDDTEEGYANLLANFAGQLEGIAYSEIDKQLSILMAELNRLVEHRKGELANSFTDEYGFTEEDYNDMLAQAGAVMTNPDATEADKLAAQEQITLYQQRKVDLQAQEMLQDERLIKLSQAKERADNMATKSKEKASERSQDEINKITKNINGAIGSLNAVKDIADAIADTFGDDLSDGAKEALGVISSIAGTAVSAVQGISSLVSGVTDGFKITVAAAAAEMSTLEKASFILTILSIAVQVISAIANVIKQFTPSAQLQKEIDKSKEKVEELKKANERLQKSYKGKSGVKYYQDMYKAAKDYDNIIKQEEESVRLAYEKYKLQLANAGGNEEANKVKKAKKQWEELRDARADDIQAQKDQFAELSRSIVGTDLKSFSKSLADSIVEGFEEGKDNIENTFDDMLNDMVKEMMTIRLSTQFEDMFSDVFDEIDSKVKNNKGGLLERNDIDNIMEMMGAAKEDATALAQTYYDIMDEMGVLTDSEEKASKGSLEGLTQDQGDQLNARFTALQIEGANVVAATQAMQNVLMQIGTDSNMRTSIMQSIQSQCNLGTQIAQNQLDELRVISAHTAAIEGHAARLKAIEQNTARL